MRFRSDPASIRGSIAPVVTPFTAEGALDTDSLRALVRWQKASGSHGVSIGGSTGEPSAQSLEERITAMRVVADELRDEIPFLPGTGAVTLEHTLQLTDEAQKLGADLALVITPYYSRPTQEGLFAWYDAVAREFPDMPIVIYNVPSRTAVDIAPDTVAKLRRAHTNIVGIKETTKDFEHFSHVLHKCGRDFLMWSGIELLCLPLLAIGGIGFVSALANLAPASVAKMYELYVAGDHQGAIDLHYRLSPLVELLFVETNPAPAKHVLADLGHISSGYVRPPLVEPTPAGLERINKLRAEAADLLVPSGVNA
ncbi:4-hydroxy-tetrahydrodipicolinate synthase [Saccharothrix obliqua]|uniref:4-hydroxy-tetrahydrodipicolinate synthase n=1 Tax=Saccharothrix obliqua TaxID=2861747 RepID=UPI001C5DAB21|nr:4-hydroxy-tetrahydrodipicolinate synthase [Saccharothrix obliqua]MBW4717821.1 4-hydroxy-tetrahydrodipicolinate synthase [Saccharothrix obliqua]